MNNPGEPIIGTGTFPGSAFSEEPAVRKADYDALRAQVAAPFSLASGQPPVMTDDARALLPCPFCGVTPFCGTAMIHCNCGAKAHKELWNRRADSRPPREAVAGLVNRLECCACLLSADEKPALAGLLREAASALQSQASRERAGMKEKDVEQAAEDSKLLSLEEPATPMLGEYFVETFEPRPKEERK